MDSYRLYGAQGSGSAAVEAALRLAGAPYDTVSADWDDFDPVAAVNPLRQVPALQLPGGELMTESAAILLHLTEAFPDARLAPLPGDQRRAAFLRWMVYVPAAIYAMYWVRDVPSRLAEGAQAEAVIAKRTAERIAECWGLLDAQVSPGAYILGDQMTVLDIYVSVVSRWTPGRRRFYEVAPRLVGPVRRVDADPRLADLWARHFPDSNEPA